MSQLMSAVLNVQSLAKCFDDAWNEMSGMWDDSVAQAFHSTYITPLSSDVESYVSRAYTNARDIHQLHNKIQALAQQLDNI